MPAVATGDTPDATLPAPPTGDPLMSVRAAAKLVPMHHSVLARQVAKGAVESTPDGQVRLSWVLRDRIKNIDHAKAHRRKGGKPLGDSGGQLELDGDGFISLSEATRRKEVWQGRLRELEYLEKSGTLVDRKAAEHLFFECARQMRDALLGWPARIAVISGANLNVDPSLLLAEIDTQVRQFLCEVGEPVAPALIGESKAQS